MSLGKEGESCTLLSMNDRIVFHVDMDAFFASIEVVRNPLLRGKPVIVGGNPDQRGVVSTCSYEARKFGVRSAMSLFEAKKRCPHGIFIEGNYYVYREYSDTVMNIFQECTPLVEIVSVDEAYMDVTLVAPKYGGPRALADLLREIVFRQTGLTCSIGISCNKLVSKIASSMAKPNGSYHVLSGTEADFLAPLPIQSIPGIGIKTQAALNEDGIKTVADLQLFSLQELIDKYGSRGYHFYYEARGFDDRAIISGDSLPKSIGAETTFEKDQTDREHLLETLQELSEKVARRLLKHKMRTRGLSLKLRFSNFETVTRSHTFFTHTQHPATICYEAAQLFESCYEGIRPLRLIGISLEKLTEGYWQPALWDWER